MDEKGNNKIRRDPIPDTFETIEEMVEFWDTHSTADYEDCFSEVVDFEVSPNVKSIFLYPIDRVLVGQLRVLANRRGVSTETLINVMLSQAVVHEASTESNKSLIAE